MLFGSPITPPQRHYSVMRALVNCFLSLNQVEFWAGQECGNEFKVTCEALKHRFLEITNVAIWILQEEENVFPVPSEQSKHPYLDLTKVEFWASQETENDFQLPFDHKIVALSTLIKSYFQFVKKQKMIQNYIRQLESSLFRLHPNSIFGCSREWK